MNTSTNNLYSMPDKVANNDRLGWYVLLICFPMSLFSIGEFRPYELAIIIALGSVFFSNKESGFLYITGTDVLVIGYLLFQIVLVLLGSDSFYESARNYRYLVLVPVLTYLTVRLLPFSLETINRGHILLAIVLFFQTALVLKLAIQYGRRPSDLHSEFVGSLVKFAVLSSYVFTYLLFLWKDKIIKEKRTFLLGLLTVIGLGVLAAASRGVLLPSLLMLFLVGHLRKSSRNKQLMLYGVSGGLLLFLLMTALVPPKFDYDETQILEDKSSLERVVSVDGYLKDIGNRIQFWSSLFDIAMDKPIFGHGASVYSLRSAKVLDTGKHIPGHTHNLFMSSVLAGGLIGLAIMLVLVLMIFNFVSKIIGSSEKASALEKSLILWSIVLLIVALTQDLKGGVATYLFFMLALLQQINLHQKKAGDYNCSTVMKDSESTSNNQSLSIDKNSGSGILTNSRKASLLHAKKSK